MPGAHDSQVPPSGPYEPAGHCVKHLDGSVLPGDEVLPVGHSLQASCPLTSLYWPAGQGTQGCPLGPVYPMLQTQAPCSRLPCSDVDPEGHIWHSLAARLSEYFPASHFKHSTSALPPCVGRYLPAGQLSHTEYEVAPIWIEYLPLAQLEQAFSVLAPSAA